MKKFIATSLLLLTQSSFAISIKDYNPYEYEVLFTNPECEEYKYDEVVYANDGTLLTAKPKNVYCKQSDFEKSSQRETSPHFQVLKLIKDSDVKEIFLTYLSFSNGDVAEELCKAVEERNVKVTMIIDSKNIDRDSARKWLDYVSTCKPKNLSDGEEPNMPATYFRGNEGGIGFAHNKIILAQYKSDAEKIKIVFSSGNMSAGTSLHHENWHFLTTNTKSYFAQAHFCVRDGMINAYDKKSVYQKYITDCRKQIEAKPESDITFYIVPSDGAAAMKNIVKNIKKADAIDGAAHRLLHPEVIDGLINAVAEGKKVRFVTDDDIYWTGKRNVVTGANTFPEFANAMKMVRGGVDFRYMETNQNHKLLHHNKYLVFRFSDGTGAVHTGAGNFTKSAFSNNFENYYFITIPEIVESFKAQYDHKFNDLATPYEKMPKTYVNP